MKCVTLLACAGLACMAQQPLTFDAASVKPVAMPVGGAGIQKRAAGPRGPVDKPTADPGRIHYPAVTLEYVLLTAYGIQNFQLAGPDWLRSERYDIDATMPDGATQEQFRTMLQNLLAQRFKLAVHRQTREASGYSLVTVKNVPKFKESAAASAPHDEDPTDPPLKLGSDGYFIPPQRPGIFLQMTRPPGARSTYRQVTMQEFADSLQSQLKRPVSDATGLKGNYDFVLSFSMEGLDLGSGRIPVSPGDEEAPPDIFSALQSQLGLKLEPKKGPVETIVIDRIEKVPTEN